MKYVLSILFVLALVLGGCQDQQDENQTDKVVLTDSSASDTSNPLGEAVNTSGLSHANSSWTCPRCQKTFLVAPNAAVPVKHVCDPI